MINQPLVNTISLYNWQDRKYVQAWDKNVVISAKATTITPILRNLSRCTPKFRSYFDEYQASNYLQNTPIGNIGSPNHMFHSMPIHWGFTLDEPRLTKGLSHFLNQSADACWLFLKALFKVQRTPGENLKKHALGFRESINNKGGTQFSRSYAVVAEKPIQIDKTNKRIDLVIS